ncbi:MAG TPA: hypothetical protein VJS92_14845 [Candidatus Polarisedimenticolaceae bacterium]|nr:hypothetical protein [Candidatus Polarisedimenticolaceae bacterium]
MAWLGFLLVLLALLGFVPFFIRFPGVTLLLSCAGLLLIGVGLVRARRKVVASILLAVATGLVAIFAYSVYYGARQLPEGAAAPRIGDRAPEFTLPDPEGRSVALSELVRDGGAVLIFYRGHW